MSYRRSAFATRKKNTSLIRSTARAVGAEERKVAMSQDGKDSQPASGPLGGADVAMIFRHEKPMTLGQVYKRLGEISRRDHKLNADQQSVENATVVCLGITYWNHMKKHAFRAGICTVVLPEGEIAMVKPGSGQYEFREEPYENP
jgi:hypothetical protein